DQVDSCGRPLFAFRRGVKDGLSEVVAEPSHLEAQRQVACDVGASSGIEPLGHRFGLRSSTGSEMAGRLKLGHALGMAGRAGLWSKIAGVPDGRRCVKIVVLVCRYR